MALGKRSSLNYKKVLEQVLRKLSGFLKKCEKLVSKSYANSTVHIKKLEKEIKKTK